MSSPTTTHPNEVLALDEVPPILRLPKELLYEIFSYVFPHMIHQPLDTSGSYRTWQTPPDGNGILRVCKAISEAALEYMYSTCYPDLTVKPGSRLPIGLDFSTPEWVHATVQMCVGVDFLKTIAPHNRRRIRRYNITAVLPEKIGRSACKCNLSDTCTQCRRCLKGVRRRITILVADLEQAYRLDFIKFQLKTPYEIAKQGNVLWAESDLQSVLEYLRRLKGIGMVEIEANVSQEFREELAKDMMSD